MGVFVLLVVMRRMLVLVHVNIAPVPVLVVMDMGMFLRVQMLVLVFSLHWLLLMMNSTAPPGFGSLQK